MRISSNSSRSVQCTLFAFLVACGGASPAETTTPSTPSTSAAERCFEGQWREDSPSGVQDFAFRLHLTFDDTRVSGAFTWRQVHVAIAPENDGQVGQEFVEGTRQDDDVELQGTRVSASFLGIDRYRIRLDEDGFEGTSATADLDWTGRMTASVIACDAPAGDFAITPPTPTSAAADVAAPPAVAPTLRWDAAALHEVEASLPGIYSEYVGEPGSVTVSRLAVSDERERTYAAFLLTQPTEGGDASSLAIASPGTTGIRVEIAALGESDFSPGVDSPHRTTLAEAFTLVGSVLRLSIRSESSYAEAATDGECRQRAQDETVATTVTVLCAPSQPCVALRTAAEVLEPGYDQDCRGRRRPRPVEAPAFVLRLEWPDPARVRLVTASGAPPAELIGEFPLADLGVAVGEELTLITDE